MSCRPRFETYTGSSTPSAPPSKRRRPRCIYTLQTPICQATSIPPCTFQGRLVIVPRRGDPTHKETLQLICESHKRSQGPSSLATLPRARSLSCTLEITTGSKPRGPSHWVRIPFPLAKAQMAFCYA